MVQYISPHAQKIWNKICFEGFDDTDNFSYRNSLTFGVDFEWNFREASRFEFE
jgi:hypothetical protein